MSSLITRSVVIHADSAFGDNLNALGSSFTLNIRPPLYIPQEAVDCTVSVDQATVQYTMPNLSVGSTTDNFAFTTRDGSSYVIPIEEGLYGMQDAVDMMNRAATSEGLGIGSSQPLFSAIGIDATQKVALGYWLEDASAALTFNTPQSSALATLLGFSDASGSDLVFSGSADTVGSYQYKVASNVAQFSALTYLKVESSLPISGVDPNGQSSATLAVIVPDVSPGSQILYRPYNLEQHDARALIGSQLSNISFSLKDNTGKLVSTLGESWSVVLRLSYTVPV